MTKGKITTEALEIRIGISRRVRPMDILPPEGYPDDRPYRWPEKTVLRRWRRRTASASDGLAYRGSRLPPSLWALIARLRMLEDDLLGMNDVTLGRWIEQARAEARAHGTFLGHVTPGVLRALLAYVTPGQRLDAMLAAHADGSHGVPDLFLFRERDGRMVDAVFVEVKRHGEALSAEQVAEISRLRALGLRAGVFCFDREPTGSRTKLRETRRKYFPNREERHLSQATGYPWEDVEACRGQEPPESMPGADEAPPINAVEEGCLGCGRPPADLEWVYFTSPAWTWTKLCGRAGWMAICPDCQYQVYFSLREMS